MYNKKRTLICITGADGSGKSTLINGLKKEWSYAWEVSIWDMLENSAGQIFSGKKAVDDYLCLLDTNARLLFLAHAMQAAIDKALQSDTRIIIINAYYYKYFASETVMGADRELVQYLASRMPVPDKTILLSYRPELSAVRKKRFSRYECGCRDATPENFIGFQTRLIAEFETYTKSDWCILDSSFLPEELCALAVKYISE
ncbi:AAA family ATPase [Xanthocytophaga agilis]|uniref:Thymidylate kinase-like domain-containing protein n=1 Tax=Xanthocytophaga agilis TaxID=3048010 RepID=A0AAE3R933_9BACT|nr:AAA family ATPase [Xanthocytophaga agilis]MDJ1505911.1 hypothetical protein [Xanthocytophaga agilis]